MGVVGWVNRIVVFSLVGACLAKKKKIQRLALVNLDFKTTFYVTVLCLKFVASWRCFVGECKWKFSLS